MAIDYDKMKARHFADVVQTYAHRDTILYALGIGLGAAPVDRDQLTFVYEKAHQVMPTFPVVLGSPGFWHKDPSTGIDWVRAVHAEQGVTLHRPIPHAATIVGRTHVVAVLDKGKDKGAIIAVERCVSERDSGELLATIESVTFCRGDGGFGDRGDVLPAPHVLPGRPADAVCDLPTQPQAALIYRLCGDDNPLHADPEVARAAGFPRPILHGLCTFGVAAHAVLKLFCGYDPARLTGFKARFSAPVFPGETIRTEMWADGAVVSFRAFAMERDALVLTAGKAMVSRPD